MPHRLFRGLALASSEAELENVPKRLQPVLPAYLLALGIGAAEITDTDLVNPQWRWRAISAYISTSMPKSFAVRRGDLATRLVIIL
jgi:hypothetical protein